MNELTQLRFFASLNYSWNQLQLWIYNPTHKQIVLSPSAVTRSDYEECPPSLSLSPEDAQRLFESLWKAGLRPAKVESAEGELAATKLHLADMQKLVFKVKP
jgi:hypothetical protein